MYENIGPAARLMIPWSFNCFFSGLMCSSLLLASNLAQASEEYLPRDEGQQQLACSKSPPACDDNQSNGIQHKFHQCRFCIYGLCALVHVKHRLPDLSWHRSGCSDYSTDAPKQMPKDSRALTRCILRGLRPHPPHRCEVLNLWLHWQCLVL